MLREPKDYTPPTCVTQVGIVEGMEALGGGVDIGKTDRQTMVKEHPIASVDQLEIPDDFLKRGRIPVVLEATKIMKVKYGNTLPIIAGFKAPITFAGYLIGVKEEAKAIEAGLIYQP